jgi:hypothetical protein
MGHYTSFSIRSPINTSIPPTEAATGQPQDNENDKAKIILKWQFPT